MVIALLVVLVAVAYANSLKIGFELDDWYLIPANPWLRSLTNVPRFFYDPYTLNVFRDNIDLRPVLATTYAINYAISEANPWSYHVLSVLIHIATSLLVFFIVRDHLWWPASERGPEGAARLPAAAAALFFALAPLNSQPVVYMSARSALLCTFFYLAAFLAFLRSRWIALALLHALALLTKAIAITLPATIVLYDFVYRDRGRYPTIAAYLSDWRRLVLPVSLTGVLGVLYMGYRHVLLPPWVRDVSHASFVTPKIWFMSQWWAQLEYVRLFFWPDNLSVDHESIYVFNLLTERALVPLALILVWIGIALSQMRRRPLIPFATLWFFITLAPESSIFPLAELTNDHRPYLAVSLSLAVLSAWGLYAVTARLGPRPTLAFVVIVLATCAAAVPVIRHRNWIWQDSVRLWQDAVRAGPTNARAWMNAGKALMDRRQLSEARRHFLKARELAPNYSFVYLNFSALETVEGNFPAALREAEEAVRIAPSFSMAHYYYGSALERVRRAPEAAAAYRRAVELNPNETRAAEALTRLKEGDQDALDMNTGVQAMYVANDPERAVTLFRKVLDRRPQHYGATLQLAKALDRLGRRSEAEPLWQKMLTKAEEAKDEETLKMVRARLAPEKEDPSAAMSRAAQERLMKSGLDALYVRKEPDVAAAEFRKVLALNPAHYGATLQLAKALDRAGKRPEAQPLWEKLLTMAEAAKDRETLTTVRARLAEKL